MVTILYIADSTRCYVNVRSSSRLINRFKLETAGIIKIDIDRDILRVSIVTNIDSILVLYPSTTLTFHVHHTHLYLY